MKEIIYKENKILQYGPTTFLATSLNEEGEVVTSLKRTLDDAKKWIENNLQTKNHYETDKY